MPGGSHDIFAPPGIFVVVWHIALLLVSWVSGHCELLCDLARKESFLIEKVERFN